MKNQWNIEGIDKRWVEGQDDRIALMAASGLSRATVDRFLDSLWKVLVSRPRTKFVGFGVYEWKPWNNRLPTGRYVKAWRLTFKPCRYTAKYEGDKKCY